VPNDGTATETAIAVKSKILKNPKTYRENKRETKGAKVK